MTSNQSNSKTRQTFETIPKECSVEKVEKTREGVCLSSCYEKIVREKFHSFMEKVSCEKGEGVINLRFHFNLVYLLSFL